MKKYKTRQTEYVAAVVCNRCTKEVHPQCAVSLDCYFGYLSKRDTQEHKSDICEDCYTEIIKDFKIKPQIQEGVI